MRLHSKRRLAMRRMRLAPIEIRRLRERIRHGEALLAKNPQSLSLRVGLSTDRGLLEWLLNCGYTRHENKSF